MVTLYNASQPTDLTGEIDLDSWYRFESADDFTGTIDGINDEIGITKLKLGIWVRRRRLWRRLAPAVLRDRGAGFRR